MTRKDRLQKTADRSDLWRHRGVVIKARDLKALLALADAVEREAPKDEVADLLRPLQEQNLED